MIKYQLYNEHNGIAIYGNDPLDAVNRQKSFPRPRHQEGEKPYGERMIANMVPTPDLMIKRAIEIEDTSNVRRGSDEFVRVICEATDGKIIGIDMCEIKMGRPSVGNAVINTLTVSEKLKADFEKRADSEKLSYPDAHRKALRLYAYGVDSAIDDELSRTTGRIIE